MKRFLKKALLVVLIVAVLFGMYWWATRNYRKSQVFVLNIKTGWSDVVDQLNQRYDLVPALVDIVKKQTKDEADLFGALDEEKKAYSAATVTDAKLQASQRLEGSIAKLLKVAEKNPKLVRDSTFLKLSDDLAGAEKGIIYEEKKYNERVRLFKMYKASLFGPLFLKIAGLSNEHYDEIRVLAQPDKK